MATGGGRKAIIAALLANAGIAVAKFVGFLITGASTMLAESWWGFVRHSKSPELPVVLLEDLGVLVGLIPALAGVGMVAIRVA